MTNSDGALHASAVCWLHRSVYGPQRCRQTRTYSICVRWQDGLSSAYACQKALPRMTEAGSYVHMLPGAVQLQAPTMPETPSYTAGTMALEP